MPGLSRRDALRAGACSGAAVLLGAGPAAAARRRLPFATEGTFAHGVGAGRPGQRDLLLWTRLDGVERSVQVGYEVARDPDFRRVVDRGRATASTARDGCVHARVRRGLEPGERYWYRFFTREATSAVGRAGTLRPPDSAGPVRIAFGSCQSFRSGFYSAHAAIAREDVDLVVHLGDYTYDGGGRGFAGRDDLTGPNGDGDCQTLGEYREKLRLYRSDPDLQALHAAHPVAWIWDDHDVEVDWAGETEGSSPPRRVTYAERKRQAHLAYFEFLPVRRDPADPFRIYESVPLGANADLLLLDTRSYRTPIPCEKLFSGAGLDCAATRDPANTMLGAAQKAWLKRRIAENRGAWQILANQVMLLGFDLPVGNRLISENWDGAVVEREELCRHVLATGRDVAVLTGDSHFFTAGSVTTDGRITGRPAMVEFVGGALSSDSAVGADATPAERAGLRAVTDQVRLMNPHHAYDNLVDTGYGVLTAWPDRLEVAFRSTDRSRRDAPARTLATFRVRRGSRVVERLS
jgi:phosphodiesterase/alkaline phosphatase D-like protein